MRLEEVEAIGREYNDLPARLQAADGFLNRPTIVIHVLDDLVEHDDVKGLVLEGQRLSRRLADVGQRPRRLSDFLGIDVHTMDIVAEASKLFDVHSDTAAYIKDPSTLERHVLSDQAEPTILAAPPSWKQGIDVWGRLPAGFEVMRSLREQFDPKRTINPGRFAGFL